MYPWLHLGPFVLSTYSLLFLCAYVVGSICRTVSPGLRVQTGDHVETGDVDEDMPALRLL
jgi:hypothetical protein